MLQVAGAKLWGLSRFQIASFIFESHFYHPIVLETFYVQNERHRLWSVP